MRQWKAGSFSMAIVLILLGSGLLLNIFSDPELFIQIVIKWWPVLPILLGIEILVAGLLTGNKKVIIKYDIVSIFLVLFFAALTLGYLFIVELSILNY